MYNPLFTIRETIASLQDRLLSLGPTNRVRWGAFSRESIFTRNQFRTKMALYGYQLSEDEFNQVWEVFEPVDNKISITNFTKFLQYEANTFQMKEIDKDKYTKYDSENKFQPPAPYEIIRSRVKDEDEDETEILREIRRQNAVRVVGELLAPKGASSGRTSGGTMQYSTPSSPESRSAADVSTPFKPVFSRSTPPSPELPVETPYGESGLVDEARSSPTRSSNNPGVIVYDNIQQIISKCMASDPKCRGTVPTSTFADICSDLGVDVNSNAWRDFISNFDSNGSGMIFYHYLAHCVCESPTGPYEKFDLARKSSYGNYAQPAAQQQQYMAQQQRMMAPPPPQYYNQYQYGNQSYQQAPYANRGGYYPDNSGSNPMYNNYYSPRTPRSRDSPTRSGSRTPRIESMNSFELIRLISEAILDKMTTYNHAFDKWSCGSNILPIINFRNGLFNDCNLDIPPATFNHLMGKYPDGMTRTTFIRVLSEKSLQEDQKYAHLTVDDRTIQKIADQIRDGQWEPIFMGSPTSDAVIQRLDRIGIVVDDHDHFRRMMMRIGRQGVIDAIKAKVRY